MSIYVVIGSILSALLLGAMSPGPSFVLVARHAVGLSRGHGLAAALGMGVGGMAFAAAALCGLYALFATTTWLYMALKIAGGCYLLYMASQVWKNAKNPLIADETQAGAATTRLRAFWVGLATQVSNPKTAVIYGSIFASLLPHQVPQWSYVALPVLVFCVEAGWYVVVALCFSGGRTRGAYLRAKRSIDRVASGVLAALGLRLILAAAKPGL